MGSELALLKQEHTVRQNQRQLTRMPINLVGGLLFLGSLAAGAFIGLQGDVKPGVIIAISGVVIAVFWLLSAQLLAEWDRAVVLRLGRFRSVRGPGFFMIVPIIDSVMRIVDMRVRTTAFHSDAILTKDTVPVEVDAIAFWHVWDSQKALLEVESYYHAIVLAVQTALRDAVGLHTLAELLSEREKISQDIQDTLSEKTEGWGLTVRSIEIRDILIPDNLKDALSKQAQAEREKQARSILGEAEQEIAEKFVQAAATYRENPVALQLRAMNILYEGLRARGSLMVVPSGVMEAIDVGSLAGLAGQTPPPAEQNGTSEED
jgi:regulator of protease activity HflC (stomatin/prohibitin superfamily)